MLLFLTMRFSSFFPWHLLGVVEIPEAVPLVHQIVAHPNMMMMMKCVGVHLFRYQHLLVLLLLLLIQQHHYYNLSFFYPYFSSYC